MEKARTQNKDDQFTTNRFNTPISTIEKKYNIDLGVRGDMKLGNFLIKKGYPSLSKMLQK
jgi:hypothetical protein